MLNNLRIGQRLLIGFGSIMLFLILISVAAIYQSYTLSGLTQDLYEHPYTVGHAMQEVRLRITKMRSAVKDIMVVKTIEEVQERARSS
ncbi:MAG: MCP four helix bundle domain-containing protein [Thiotrichaceae bacterium]